MKTPNYNKIYFDLIDRKYPERRKEFKNLLSKEIKTSLELIKINANIFNHQSKDTLAFNQKLHSYDKESIKRIIEYQKINKLNNIQTCNLFKISRTTLTKWKNLVIL